MATPAGRSAQIPDFNDESRRVGKAHRMIQRVGAAPGMTWSNGNALEVLCLLISADLLFITLHLLHTYSGYFSEPTFSLEQDHGYPEMFQYLKEYWIGLMFLGLMVLKSYPGYAAWSAVFGYLLLDDSFQLHEVFGLRIAEYFQFAPMMRLRARDLGELTVTGFVVGAMLFLIAAACYRGTKEFRKISATALTMLAVLAFFGVGVDMLHVMVGEASPFYKPLGAIEDGGEMLVLSGICAFASGLLRHHRSSSLQAPQPHRVSPFRLAGNPIRLR